MNLRASSDATPLQLRTPSSTARAETASRPAGVEAAIGAQNAEAGAVPRSGWGRLASTALIKASVFGPILPAHRRNRSGVHSAQRRWELGIWLASGRAAASVAALMGADVLAAMEDLDRSR